MIMRPTKPMCYNGCSDWQINEYKSQVSTYFDGLRQYAADVDAYYKKAGDYIQCMAKLD